MELRAPDRAIGRDTASAIQAGTVIGYQALAGGLIDRVRRELAASEGIAPASIRVVLTGGLSALPWVAGIAESAGIAGNLTVDPDLTLRGLAHLHAEVGRPLAVGR